MVLKLKATKITGLLVIFGSIFLTILFYLIRKEILFKMNPATKKWMFLKISSAILLPLMIWFILSLVSIFDKDIWRSIVIFLPLNLQKFYFQLMLVFAYFFLCFKY